MQKAPFYLYLRQRKGKEPVWYVKYRDADGKILSPVCTDETDKDKATKWAVSNAVKLATAQREWERNPRGQTFKEWAADWWLPSCPYITEKRADGFNISATYSSIRRSYLTRHLLPEFGKYRLSELRPAMLRDFKMKMKNAGKPQPATINQILGTMRIMLGYAVEMDEIETNPMSPVGELKEEPRQRGILTPSELAELFGPGALEKVWHGELRHYAANMLSASTGMRRRKRRKKPRATTRTTTRSPAASSSKPRRSRSPRVRSPFPPSAPTIRCGCISARWARSSCCRARARSRSPSASKPAARR